MTLKKTLASLEAVPENLKPLYKKSGAQFVLDLEDEETASSQPANAGESARLKEFRQKNIELMQQMEALQAQYSGIDPEAYKRAMAVLDKTRDQEERDLLKGGQFDEVLRRRVDSVRGDYEKKLQKATADLQKASESSSKLQQKLHRTRVETMLRQAMDSAKVQPEGPAMFDINSRALAFFSKIDENGEPYAVDEHGDPMTTRDGKPFGPGDFVTKLVDDAPHLFHRSEGAAIGGAGRRGATTSGRVGAVLNIDPSDPNAFGANIENIATGKVTVRYQS